VILLDINENYIIKLTLTTSSLLLGSRVLVSEMTSEVFDSLVMSLGFSNIIFFDGWTTMSFIAEK